LTPAAAGADGLADDELCEGPDEPVEVLDVEVDGVSEADEVDVVSDVRVLLDVPASLGAFEPGPRESVR
jgi:hypothetical protein